MKTFCQLSTFSAEHPKLATIVSAWIPAEDIHRSFQYNIGGDIFVIESKEEYLQVWDDDAPFDIIDDSYPDGWVMLALINNNSGGPTWFVKKSTMNGTTPA